MLHLEAPDRAERDAGDHRVAAEAGLVVGVPGHAVAAVAVEVEQHAVERLAGAGLGHRLDLEQRRRSRARASCGCRCRRSPLRRATRSAGGSARGGPSRSRSPGATRSPPSAASNRRSAVGRAERVLVQPDAARRRAAGSAGAPRAQALRKMRSPCSSMICCALVIEKAIASSLLVWVSTRMNRCSLTPSSNVLAITPAVFQPEGLTLGRGRDPVAACTRPARRPLAAVAAGAEQVAQRIHQAHVRLRCPGWRARRTLPATLCALLHPTGRSAALPSGKRPDRRNQSPETTLPSRSEPTEAMMAKNHGPQIKDDEQYEALRKQGASKEKAARIANTREASPASAAASRRPTRTGPRTTSISGPRRSASMALRHEQGRADRRVPPPLMAASRRMVLPARHDARGRHRTDPQAQPAARRRQAVVGLLAVIAVILTAAALQAAALVTMPLAFAFFVASWCIRSRSSLAARLPARLQWLSRRAVDARWS